MAEFFHSKFILITETNMSKIISQKRFISNALDAHNKYRKLHGADPLEHSPDLSDSAQDWAEHLASNNILKYKNSKYNDEFLGENILRAYTAYIDGDEVSDMWYKEEANYKYDGTFQKIVDILLRWSGKILERLVSVLQ